MLPPENQVVLKYLLGFLKRVSRLQELNKMTLQNLGTVFGPCILRSTVDDMQALVRDTPFVNEVAQILIDQEAKFVAPDIAVRTLFQLLEPSLLSVRTRLDPTTQTTDSCPTRCSTIVPFRQ
jgi:hypothetical protein